MEWLLEGDISIQYQVHRDLLGHDDKSLQSNINSQGWGKRLFEARTPNGRWGYSFYQPKWISTHYTLLDLRNLCVSPKDPLCQRIVKEIALNEKGQDGGLDVSHSNANSDVCVNGMFLNYASYFQIDEDLLHSIIDFILSQIMPDGGFNCMHNRSGAVHSSLHSTLSILEGITEYERNGYTYRLPELQTVKNSCVEFILIHHLFKSDKTGKIIKNDFLKFPFSPRWKYDILRCLDYFQHACIPYDHRMNDALKVVENKKTADGLWKVNARYSGLIHFEMEKAGKPSRWNTLRALRVLKCYDSGNDISK